MLLNRKATGWDGISAPIKPNHSKSNKNIFTQTSNTGHFEKRLKIRNQWVYNLIQEHNRLVELIISRWNISETEKNILLAMRQEWIQIWWKFYWMIEESKEDYHVLHWNWITQYNPITWSSEIIRGNSRLKFWEIIWN